MSHNINGYIGYIGDLERACKQLNFDGAVFAKLDYGDLVFMPDYGFRRINSVKHFMNIGREASQCAYIETDYFGGGGTQRAYYYEDGRRWKFETKSAIDYPRVGNINKALRLMGVFSKSVLLDEFDTVGLGKFRTNEKWALFASGKERGCSK